MSKLPDDESKDEGENSPSDDLESDDNIAELFSGEEDDDAREEDQADDIQQIINALDRVAVRLSERMAIDLIAINSDMDMDTAHRFIDQVRQWKRYDKLHLFLTTPGGDAGAAYKIASSARELYEKGFSVVVHGYCKSAGTICALGAQEIVMSDKAELGPIDVQLYANKRDDIGGFHSGLEIDAAFEALNGKVLDMFMSQVVRFMTPTQETEERGSFEGSVSLELATKIATSLTVGIFAPLYARFDPLYIGEASRGMDMAIAYGSRLAELGGNLREDENQLSPLLQLIYGYPGHGFVIDRSEASKLFKQVRPASADENFIANGLETLMEQKVRDKDKLVWFLSPPREDDEDDDPEEDEEAIE